MPRKKKKFGPKQPFSHRDSKRGLTQTKKGKHKGKGNSPIARKRRSTPKKKPTIPAKKAGRRLSDSPNTKIHKLKESKRKLKSRHKKRRKK